MGEADAGGGRIYNASPFTAVVTAPAYINAPAIPLVAVEQGKETFMVAKLEQLLPFEGEATAQVLGVPDTIPIEPAKITKDTKEVSFKVVTNDKSPIGKQANLFVRVDILSKAPMPPPFIALRWVPSCASTPRAKSSPHLPPPQWSPPTSPRKHPSPPPPPPPKFSPALNSFAWKPQAVRSNASGQQRHSANSMLRGF